MPYVIGASLIAALAGAWIYQGAVAVELLALGYSLCVAMKYASMQDGPMILFANMALSVYFMALAPYFAALEPTKQARWALLGTLIVLLLGELILAVANLE